VSGRRAAGVVGDWGGVGAGAGAVGGREAGARQGFGECLAGGLAGCAIGFLDRHGEREVGGERGFCCPSRVPPAGAVAGVHRGGKQQMAARKVASRKRGRVWLRL